jgi:transposase InsO family protein
MTRDAYYKHCKRQERRREREEQVVRLVKETRQELPRSGARKLLHELRPKLEEQGCSIGRDALFSVLRTEDLLVKPRRKCPITTYSAHEYAVAPNRLREAVITGPAQAVAADITYLRLQAGFCYLFLLTDVYSRMIVGWHLSESLAHDGAVAALEMALRNNTLRPGALHHSDRGAQYCCHEFMREAKDHGIVLSMTDANHCAQNALAERVNGILKDEFYIDLRFNSLAQARRAVANAILVYNTRRPHLSLDYKKPFDVHFSQIPAAA